MTTTTANQAEIYSSFGDDPDLGDLVEMFVSEIPDRITTLMEAFESGDTESLRRTAHQLKGAAGSYGFDQLTPYSAALERSVIDACPEETVQQALQDLVGICKFVRNGTASGAA